MSRSRNIKPGFFENEVLAALDSDYQLLFIGLWTQADRDGRLEYRPARLKIKVFPYRDERRPIDLVAGIVALANAGFIRVYTAGDGSAYIQVLNWAKHQNPHHKEVPSVIPPCQPDSPNPLKTTEYESTVYEESMHESCMNHAQTVDDSSKTLLGPLIPDSRFLIPDSLDKHSPAGAGRLAGFEEFYASWPTGKRKKRKAAEAHWKTNRLDTKAEQIIADVIVRKREDQSWLRGFVPAPVVYLRGEGWNDDIDRNIPQVRASPAATPSRTRALYDQIGDTINDLSAPMVPTLDRPRDP